MMIGLLSMGGQIEGEPKAQAAKYWSQWGSRRSGIWEFGGARKTAARSLPPSLLPPAPSHGADHPLRARSGGLLAFLPSQSRSFETNNVLVKQTVSITVKNAPPSVSFTGHHDRP
ncbi:hypothetical protein BO78DRAFT_129290 [Aspergillus sclerotiicarbonarius CBS 121057]|uniref:Uncharacterized protein n=1 Tax=Aspergillus sclerotiicarbonarius (strain CBS 121057 / IBT 28362) TaxID=1448318 RepID=A0A319E7B9_ASPSB|nr:hypothetical protein BO78DRAFT_129290 [Aspergillus sclerotiicarbonarius CBS 121057]